MEYGHALVIFAHPDDAEFLCGGTIAVWTAAGTDVSYVCVTDGSAGWNGPDRSRDEIAEIRRSELRRAADVLGVRDVRLLGYTDGRLEASLDLRRDLAREVRRARPDVLVTFDPSMRWSGRRYINHPDHRAVGEAVLAVVACDAPTRPQFPELLDEGFEPYEVPALWLATAAGEGDRLVDIGDTLDRKVEAIRVQESQVENMGDFDVEDRIRRWAKVAAADADMEYAETFRTFDLGGD
jgi:LmbE family N-acetylglucosaminyl deacetylase